MLQSLGIHDQVSLPPEGMYFRVLNICTFNFAPSTAPSLESSNASAAPVRLEIPNVTAL